VKIEALCGMSKAFEEVENAQKCVFGEKIGFL
jgi:hypothetical protein